MSLTRRRFVQFAVTSGAQAQTLVRSAVSGIAAFVAAACVSLRDTFSRTKRWVIPSTVGDFVIHTSYDPQKVTEFPLLIWADRIQFPAVAATMLGPGDTIDEIDSDQVMMRGVWVVIQAKKGTQLFRERDIVRSDVLRAQPSGDFTLEFTLQPLLPPFGEIVPMTVDVANAPRAPKRRDRASDRDQLIKFDFCVRPEVCQSGVHSTLPTVVARWPKQLDLLIYPAGAAVLSAHRLHHVGDYAVEHEHLGDCGGPARNLRWVAVQYDLPGEVAVDVRAHANGDKTVVLIKPGTIRALVRPGFVDLLIPAGSLLERRHDVSILAQATLDQSHFHSANLQAFAWVSDMPSETTTLPAELSSTFCFKASGPEPWPLAPDAIDVMRTGGRIEFVVPSNEVTQSRIAVTLRKRQISRSIEQTLKETTLVFRSANGQLQPRVTLALTTEKTTHLRHSVFDQEGRFDGAELAASNSGFILVADLFARMLAVKELDLRFRERSGRYELGESSTMLFTPNETAWAGRQSQPASKGDWVHLRVPEVKPLPDDHRATNTFTPDSKTRIRWSVDGDRFQIIEPVPVEVMSEIVSIAPEAFRAVKKASFAPKEKGEVEFPPFALREHRDLIGTPNSRWLEDSTHPNHAFRADTMWEPRTKGVAATAPDSPAEFFTAIADAEGGAGVLPVYAGFALSGELAPLGAREWGPDATCHKDVFAPYRAVAAQSIRLVDDAEDVVDLAKPPLRDCMKLAFREVPNNDRRKTLNAVANDSKTEIALSPVGGTIGYDWNDLVRRIGLQELVLHGYLGRYQKNYAIFADLLLPYGILINYLTLTSRQDSGRLRYCTKWWFTEESKYYGDKKNIVIDNLRPINAVNFDMGGPLRFKADIHYRNGNELWTDRDRTLQGVGLIVARTGALPQLLRETVPLTKPQALTLFKDTPLRLAEVEWRAVPNGKAADPCEPPSGVCADAPQIIVTARGELEDVGGMTFDTRAVDTIYDNTMDANQGTWCKALADQLPDYKSRALTLGDGVVRVDHPLKRDDTFELNARAEHKLVKKIKMRDVGLMQLVLGGDDDFLENEGTLTVSERLILHDKQVNKDAVSTRDQSTDAEVQAEVDFPDFTKGVQDVCEGSIAFRIKIKPRSFHASFNKSIQKDADYNAKLVADIGVPGLLVLKNCELTSRPGTAVDFKPGDFSFCGELLKKIIEPLLDKLKDLLGFGGGGGGGKKKSPFDFDLTTDPFGFLVKLRLPLPRIPFGTGSLENVVFDFRLLLAIDISRSGINTGAMLTFIFGDYPEKDLGKWLDLDLPDFGMAIFKKLRPPTLTITPFTVRFSTIISVRVKPPKSKGLSLPDPFKKVCFQAAACINGEGGLALAFDIGVAHGTISITLGIVWCPHAEYLIDQGGTNENFSFDEIALVARLELNASVLGVVNIFVRVQAMAQLKLSCKESILTHLEVSGTATIEILFASIDVSFTVNCDPLLGINPDACKHDKKASDQQCALPPPNDLARVAMAEFFSHAEVAA